MFTDSIETGNRLFVEVRKAIITAFTVSDLVEHGASKCEKVRLSMNSQEGEGVVEQTPKVGKSG